MYTVVGCVKNSKGRFVFTDVIEAQSKEIAQDIYKQRAKKEFTGVRAVNRIEINDYKDGDLRSIEEMKETKVTNVPDKEIYTDQDLADSLFITIVNMSDNDLYKVTYAPSSKKSILKRIPKLYFVAKGVDEMKLQLRKEITALGIEYSEKYIQNYVKVDLDSEEIRSTDFYKAICSRMNTWDEELKNKYKELYQQIDKGSDIYSEEFKAKAKELIDKLPESLFSPEIGEELLKKIESKKDISPIPGLDDVRDLVTDKSVLGDNYSLAVIKEGTRIKSIKPDIPLFINAMKFKTYRVDLYRGKTLVFDDCEVVAESQEKVSAYSLFVCRREKLLNRGDAVKIVLKDFYNNKISDYFFVV